MTKNTGTERWKRFKDPLPQVTQEMREQRLDELNQLHRDLKSLTRNDVRMLNKGVRREFLKTLDWFQHELRR